MTYVYYNKEAEKVVAVTGSIAPKQQPRALIVVQNPHSAPSVGSFRLTVVKKDNRSLEEVVTGYLSKCSILDNV